MLLVQISQNILFFIPDSYDALGIAGGMGEGHIPVESISEMIRVVIPGKLSIYIKVLL